MSFIITPPDNEKDCFKKLIQYRWKSGYRCIACGGIDYWIKPERRIVICSNCRKEISALAGSMFSRSHIPLASWLKLIHLVCCSPDRVITAKSIYRELDLGSYRTAWEALNKIRFAISRNEPRKKLSGTIEFDEMVIAGQGEDYRKLSILGALELDGKKRLSLQLIKNPDEMNIKAYFRKRFGKGLNVIINPEKLYIRNWLELNRIRQISSSNYYGSNFMNLHVILQDVRYGLRNGHHSVSEKYMQRNLDEYVFVFNHNEDRTAAYEIVLDYMVNTGIKEYTRAENTKRSVFSIIKGE